MTQPQPIAQVKKPDLICNFRAPSLKEFGEWQEYKQYVKDQGLDVCRVTIGLTNAFMSGVKGAAKVTGQEQNVQIQMNNQFLYQVSKPRREPFSLSCVKPEFRRTFSSILFESYVLDKARRKIKGEFSYRDFLELNHQSFRRIIIRLKRKGLVMGIPERTVPMMYLLAEQVKVR
jgi:hypothetical protein